MCRFNISLNDDVVIQARQSFASESALTQWLQQQVERWLLAQVNSKNQPSCRHSKLTDEMLAERLKDYPPLEESNFPSLAAEDYGTYLKSNSGKLSKGLEKWL